MNVNDSSVVQTLLRGAGLVPAPDAAAADVVLFNTCSVREKAERRVWARLRDLRAVRRQRRQQQKQQPRPGPVVCVLGCMAARLRAELAAAPDLADVVVGPDGLRDLPALLSARLSATRGADAGAAANGCGSADAMEGSSSKAEEGEHDHDEEKEEEEEEEEKKSGDDASPLRALASEPAGELYDDIFPFPGAASALGGGVSAFLTVMRGCNRFCSYCIVPYVRGRERSRPLASLLAEAERLAALGRREIVLLGQNVNGYSDRSAGREARFEDLLVAVADRCPDVRIRFTAPHPRNFRPAVLDAIAARANIARAVHMPPQSGSTSVLRLMKRGYTREGYMRLVEDVRAKLGAHAGISGDFIAGFCGETEDEHAETLSLLRAVGFTQAFMFAYSQRSGTVAARTLADDVPPDEKNRRLREIIATFNRTLEEDVLPARVGREIVVLVDTLSERRGEPQWVGRGDDGLRVAIPCTAVPSGAQILGRFVAARTVGVDGHTLSALPLHWSDSFAEAARHVSGSARAPA